jgi:hypothetical protein
LIITSSKFGVQQPNKRRVDKLVAVCISGQIRDKWEITLASIKKYIINVLNADVFIHFNDLSDDSIKLRVLNILQPREYVFKDINKSVVSGYNSNFERMMSRMIECNDMKKNEEILSGHKYDIVIKLRPDMLIKSSIPDRLLDNMKPNTIYNYELQYWPFLNMFGMTDIYLISDSATMDKLMVKDVINMKMKHCDYSEYILYRFCKKNKINIDFFYGTSNITKYIDQSLASIVYDYVKTKGLVIPKFVCDKIE